MCIRAVCIRLYFTVVQAKRASKMVSDEMYKSLEHPFCCCCCFVSFFVGFFVGLLLLLLLFCFVSFFVGFFVGLLLLLLLFLFLFFFLSFFFLFISSPFYWVLLHLPPRPRCSCFCCCVFCIVRLMIMTKPMLFSCSKIHCNHSQKEINGCENVWKL